MAGQIYKKLEEYLEKYQYIVVVDLTNADWKRLLEKALKKYNNECGRKNLFLVWEDGCGLSNPVYENVAILSDEEYREIREIYSTYECSDRIRVLAGQKNYPSVFNYLKTGLLTEQECFDALMS
jgi:hypothetical protein